MYLEHEVGSNALVANHGNGIVGDVELEIGGQRIDKHTGHWMETWAELTEPNPTGSSVNADTTAAAGNATKYQLMARRWVPNYYDMVEGCWTLLCSTSILVLQKPWSCFTFNCLQYHEVKVVLTFGATPNRCWIY